MKNKKRGITVIESLVILTIIGIVVTVVLSSIGLNKPNSGQHTGIITAIEQHGFIWRTTRAYVKTSAQSTQEDEYCVTDPTVIAQLQDDAANTREVTVYYSGGLFIWPWQCTGEGSIINAVK